MNSEGKWVEAACAGDRTAFARLVELFQRPVFSLCYRMLGNPSDAEDAAQEAFLKAYRALAAYDPGRPFSTWLLAIAAHDCIDRIRRRRLQEVSLDAMPRWRWKPAEVDDPEDVVVESDEAAHMARLLAQLPEDYRLVVVLRYWHDLGYAEIAEILGDTESAVKSRLHRARRQLAVALAAEAHSREPGRPAGSNPPPATPLPAMKGGLIACRALMPGT
jgi:RNA polymerase sigma-70 factor (ECF subfamily)